MHPLFEALVVTFENFALPIFHLNDLNLRTKSSADHAGLS